MRLSLSDWLAAAEWVFDYAYVMEQSNSNSIAPQRTVRHVCQGQSAICDMIWLLEKRWNSETVCVYKLFTNLADIISHASNFCRHCCNKDITDFLSLTHTQLKATHTARNNCQWNRMENNVNINDTAIRFPTFIRVPLSDTFFACLPAHPHLWKRGPRVVERRVRVRIHDLSPSRGSSSKQLKMLNKWTTPQIKSMSQWFNRLWTRCSIHYPFFQILLTLQKWASMFPSVSPSHPSPYSQPLPPPQLYTNCLTESGPNSVLSLRSLFLIFFPVCSSLSDSYSQICANLWVLKSFSAPLSHSSTTHSMEDERSTHADRSRGRSVLTAGKSDWRGRETEWETKSNMGMTSEPTVKTNREADNLAEVSLRNGRNY